MRTSSARARSVIPAEASPRHSGGASARRRIAASRSRFLSRTVTSEAPVEEVFDMEAAGVLNYSRPPRNASCIRG